MTTLHTALGSDAQRHLDAANALYAGRYEAALDRLGRTVVIDTTRGRRSVLNAPARADADQDHPLSTDPSRPPT